MVSDEVAGGAARGRFVERYLTLLLAEVLEKHEAGDDVTVVCGGVAGDGAFLFQTAGNAVKGFVGEVVGCGAVLAIEVENQAAANLHIPLAAGIRTVVQPIQRRPRTLLL